jgi:hypothetical protein
LIRYYPDQKHVVLPIRDDLELEISWFMDSTQHFDDQLQVFRIADNLVGLIIADGVSSSSGGRIASVYLSHYIPEFIAENTSKNVSGFELQELGQKAIDYAVDKLVKIETKTGTSNSSFIDLIIQSKQLEEVLVILEEPAKRMDYLEINHEKFSNEYSEILNKVKEQGISIKRLQKMIEYLQGYLYNLQQEGQSLKENKSRIYSSLNRIVNDEVALNSLFKKDRKKVVDTIRKAIKIIEQAENSTLELIGRINGVKDDNSRVSFENIELLKTGLHKNLLSCITAIKEVHDSFRKKLPDWLPLVLFYIDERRENTDSLLENLSNRMKLQKRINFESTLAFVLIEILSPENDEKSKLVRFWSYMLGDPEAFILTSDKQWISHYKTTEGKLKSYVSSIKGIGGRMDICARYLGLNDVLIVGCDGANLKWTSKGGYSFVPLLKLINTGIQSNSIEKIPAKWFQKLTSNNAITDDFSLIAAWIRKNDQS